VHRTVPGDRAEIEVVHSGARWARGRLLTLLDEGPDRRSAPCPYFDRCGGCTLQHLRYEGQLAAKASIVTAALHRIGKRENLPAARLHAAPEEFHYRNRLTFTLRRLSGGRVVAGLHAMDRPERIVDVDDRCLLGEVPVLHAWKGLREGWGPGARLLPEGEELRLTLRATAGGEVLLVVAGGHGDGDPVELLARVPGLRAIWRLSSGDGSEPVFLAGDQGLTEEWMGEAFRLGPMAFLQVNRRAAELLHRAVVRAMGEVREMRVLDAYCGSGGYGRWAACRGAQCIGIESDPGAARMAREGVEVGFSLLEGRVEDRIGEALPADLALLNPPRAGVEDGVMERLAAAVTPRLIYVSCDPATLARDVARLGSSYAIRTLEVFDLFPQTARVETLLTLTKS